MNFMVKNSELPFLASYFEAFFLEEFTSLIAIDNRYFFYLCHR